MDSLYRATAPCKNAACLRLGELLRPLGLDLPIVPLATGIAHKGSLELVDGNRPVADANVVGRSTAGEPCSSRR